MNRPQVSSLFRGFVAFALALLLPLEASHCLWMGSATATSPASVEAAADPHACCAGLEAPAPDAPAPDASPMAPARHVPAPQCLCLELPPAAPSPVVVTPMPQRAALATPIAFPAHCWQAAHGQPIDFAESPPPETPPDVSAARGPPAHG
jgi:hypothetical protein